MYNMPQSMFLGVSMTSLTQAVDVCTFDVDKSTVCDGSSEIPHAGHSRALLPTASNMKTHSTPYAAFGRLGGPAVCFVIFVQAHPFAQNIRGISKFYEFPVQPAIQRHHANCLCFGAHICVRRHWLILTQRSICLA